MMQKIKLFIALLVLAGAGADTAIAQQDDPLQVLRDKFRDGKIFKAEFVHGYKDSYTGQTQESSGEVWVGDNEYKVISQSQQVLVYDGLSRAYDENRNRVVVSIYEPQEDDFAPSKFLTGTDTLYTVAEQEVKQDTVRITLKSDDPFTVFKRIGIRLNAQLIPLRIRAIDQADNIVTTTFKSGAFIEKRKNIFNLNYPEDAKIIDLRE